MTVNARVMGVTLSGLELTIRAVSVSDMSDLSSPRREKRVKASKSEIFSMQSRFIALYRTFLRDARAPWMLRANIQGALLSTDLFSRDQAYPVIVGEQR